MISNKDPCFAGALANTTWKTLSCSLVQNSGGISTFDTIEVSCELLICPEYSFLSFPDDNNDEADDNGEFNSASCEKEKKSFVVCAAFSADAWNIKYLEDAVLTHLHQCPF